MMQHSKLFQTSLEGKCGVSSLGGFGSCEVLTRPCPLCPALTVSAGHGQDSALWRKHFLALFCGISSCFLSPFIILGLSSKFSCFLHCSLALPPLRVGGGLELPPCLPLPFPVLFFQLNLSEIRPQVKEFQNDLGA